jgi:hypothetical protein
MLSTSHKVHLLQRAGIAVPPASTTFLLSPGERASAQARWEDMVENLFIAYAMARAQKSLGDEDRAHAHPAGATPEHRAGVAVPAR